MTAVVRGLQQACREAIVASLDTYGGITALTGRASQNVVPRRGLDAAQFPCVAYTVAGGPRTGAPGDQRKIKVKLSAFAAAEPPESGADEGGDALCHALLDQIEAGFTTLRCSQLTPPFDMRPDTVVRSDPEDDPEFDALRADLEYDLTANR